ncbi:hypothetical protein [Photobacterium iliopiscarium]|uniref:hypothetical protein n=1 Tax=Photobacterium iliopiscarium TaxID=56192 RepID=UPI001E6453CC|nr:hypothetical protein [Photobacterium iliopiscarium]MCD9466540.1 hypothetical protein [Photobacterium iliopiscarium]MCD9486925.1 hypothetical protein [Photobacterium iliopiscarium]MCF2243474.1 hypothetical protein [Photobacterium iliopiscarium]
MEQFFDQTSSAEVVLPTKALSCLPFAQDCFSGWDENCDLRIFLNILFSEGGYGEYGDYTYSTKIEEFNYILELFQDGAAVIDPELSPEDPTYLVPDFANSIEFSLAAKYAIAWDAVVSNMLSESAFFSLPHILESRTDLECSIHMCAGLFYKQACQNLRSFLEGMVLQLHFCLNPESYKKWKVDDYRTPPLRGKKGLLQELENQSLIDSRQNRIVSNLYDKFNGYIHGSASLINNKGTQSGEWKGKVFKVEEFSNWSKLFAETIQISLELLSAHLRQYEGLNLGDKICNICHSKDLVCAIEGTLHKFACNQCDNIMTFDGDGNKKVKTTVTYLEP